MRSPKRNSCNTPNREGLSPGWGYFCWDVDYFRDEGDNNSSAQESSYLCTPLFLRKEDVLMQNFGGFLETFGLYLRPIYQEVRK